MLDEISAGAIIMHKKPSSTKLPDGTWHVTYHFHYRSDQGLGFDWFEADDIGDACCAKLAEIERKWER